MVNGGDAANNRMKRQAPKRGVGGAIRSRQDSFREAAAKAQAGARQARHDRAGRVMDRVNAERATITKNYEKTQASLRDARRHSDSVKGGAATPAVMDASARRMAAHRAHDAAADISSTRGRQLARRAGRLADYRDQVQGFSTGKRAPRLKGAK